MKAATRQPVLDQQLALGVYLDDLLGDAAASPPVADAAPQPAPIEQSAMPAEPPPAVIAPVADATVPEGAVAAPREGVPAWAGVRFQAQLFVVAGLTLAVPLVRLKGVVSDTRDVTPVPGQPSPYAGVVAYQGLQSLVVDMARIVLPPERAAQLDDNVAARCHNLVIIDEGRLALACTRIGGVIELDSAAVKWRGASGKRLWLAGTVVEHRCALLDIDQLSLVLTARPT